jgi:hypothetical protein
MSVAQRKVMDDDDVMVSDDARRRVDMARIRELSFSIKKAIGIDDERAEALAVVLIEAKGKGITPTRGLVFDRLREMGVPLEAASEISSILPEG